MCMMDWRIGRLVRHKFTAGTAGQDTVLLANQQRVAIIVSMIFNDNPLADVSYISVTFPGGGLFNISEVNQPYSMSLLTHGDLVLGNVTVSDGQGITPINVCEFFLPESYLAAGLEQFESEYARGHR